ncbi:hypothetical protein LTR72_007029 [Exophiala xenobiotica]|nr:hypothetical protein LTR41_008916 [Exophiala xenobiotica]KAK5220407.1 hypothetical protein LTR72_007029 [Exophiala xenobiotica]KAK5257930.1 hypothetical protein LTR40_008915 [Exophiala xenobiotica]KAK5290680.1 hypothetical protein LTR14_006187 [Exophiala xenobiotica]KAK5314754.1 hypothetical protein LTR93_010137 [Exophiala xenobiotica]
MSSLPELSEVPKSEILDLSRTPLGDLYKTSLSDRLKMFPSIDPSHWKDPRCTRYAWVRARQLAWTMVPRSARWPTPASSSTPASARTPASGSTPASVRTPASGSTPASVGTPASFSTPASAPTPTPAPAGTNGFIGRPCPSTADLITYYNINLVRSRKNYLTETYEPFRRCLAAIDQGQASRNTSAFHQAVKSASQTLNSPPMVQLFRDVRQDRIMKHAIVGKLESVMDNRNPNDNDNYHPNDKGYSGPPPRSQHRGTTSKTLAATSTATATMAEARLTATRRAFWTYHELWATADMIHSAMLGFSRRLKTYVAVVKRVAERRKGAPQMQALTQTALSEEEEGKASPTPTATPVARRTIPWEMVWLETDHRKRKLRELLQHRSMATNKGGDVEMKDG